MIEDCAKRYLAGEAMTDLAAKYEIKAWNLWKVLTRVSGTSWQIEFTSKALNIHEVVPLTIPPLLDEETIRAIKAKVEANRTYTHGHIKHHYLFARMVSCAHCGYAMLGQTNHDGRRYYRHYHVERDRACPGPKRKVWIPAVELEDNAMRYLFETFGNPAAVQRAIEEATPNDEKVQQAAARLTAIAEDLVKLERSRQRILDLVVKGTIAENSASTQLGKLKEREQKLTDERTRLADELAHLPSRESVQQVSKFIAGQFARYTNARVVAKGRHANEAFDEMTYAEKRELCQRVFGGKTADGRRMGIWITWSPDGQKWGYRIEGHLIDASGPANKDGFVFGMPSSQKALVTSLAWH